MAKSKKKKNAFPKHVAGVKLSKKMRKRGASMKRFANSPIGSALIAETTVAAIKGVLTNERVRDTAAEAGRDMQRMAMVAAMRIGAVAAAARDAALQSADAHRDGKALDDEAQPSRAEQARARRAAQKAERDDREATAH